MPRVDYEKLASDRAGEASEAVRQRVLKLTRTIADLAGAAEIQAAHLAEAIQYRPRHQG